MGFFASSAPPAPKISTDGAPIAPDRSQRAKCWEARDAFFQCLEKNDIIDSIGEKTKADKACGAEDNVFARDCASSWVRSPLAYVLEYGVVGVKIVAVVMWMDERA